MKSFDLDVRARLALTNLLSAQDGNVGTLRMWNRMLDKIELSVEERAKIKLQVEGASLLWDAEASADKTVELEDEQARALFGLLNSWEHFKRPDLVWLDPVLAKLS